jgi:2-hydroxychromene-2-carboxylate isomerase
LHSTPDQVLALDDFRGRTTILVFLGPTGVQAFARSLGLPLPAFDADLEDDELRQRIEKDFMSGVRSGVNGTPSFFVNGVEYEGAIDADAFRQMLATGAEASP